MKKSFNVFLPIMLMDKAGEPSGGGGGGKTPDEIMADRVRTMVADQVRSQQGSDESKAVIKAVLETFVGNMSADQVRTALADTDKLKKDLADLSSAVEKNKQQQENRNQNINRKAEVLADIMAQRAEAIEGFLGNKASNQFMEFNSRAAVIMTTDNIVDLGDITAEELESGFAINGFVGKRRGREFIFDIADRVTVRSIEQYKRWWEEGDDEGAFAIVEEGQLKPMVSMNLVLNTSEYKKVAGHSVYTDEVVKFKREAYNIIRRLINDKLLRDYHNILTVDLVAAAAPYVGSALDGQYANPTDFHAIAAVAAQIEGINFYPDTLIINPQDKWRIGMSQDLNGQFYLAIPQTSPDGTTRMLGFNVITSTRIAQGKFLLGEAGLWKIEDEGVTVKIGYGTTEVRNPEGVLIGVQDDISHNRFRVISEMFFHSYIASNHQGSFVYGDFAVIKELLQAPPVTP